MDAKEYLIAKASLCIANGNTCIGCPLFNVAEEEAYCMEDNVKQVEEIADGLISRVEKWWNENRGDKKE